MITNEFSSIGIIAAIVANGIVQDKKYMEAISKCAVEKDRSTAALVSVDIAKHIVEKSALVPSIRKGGKDEQKKTCCR